MKKIVIAACLIPYFGTVVRADTPREVSDLIHRLRSDNVDERERAAQALGAMGPEAAGAVNALRQALNDDLPYVRTLSIDALTKIGPAAIPAFIDALNNDNAEVRATAANALGRYGDQAHAAIGGLVKALQDSDLPVRQGAARALEQLGPAAAPALIANLEASQPSTRILTLQVLSNIHGTDAAVIPPLLKVLEDPDRQVRLAADKALVRLGSEHIPELMEGLKSDKAMVRVQAADIFGDIRKRGAAAVPLLTDLLKDASPEVRGSAARALGKMGSSASSSVPALKEATKDADAGVAGKAEEALTNITSLSGGETTAETKVNKAPATPANAASAVPPVAKPQAQPKKKTAAPKPAAKPAAKKAAKKGKAPPLPPPTPQELMLQFQSTDVVVSSRAAQMIIQRSSETVPLLIQSLQEANTTFAEMSAGLLTTIGTDEAKKAVDAYQKRLLDKKTAALLKDLRQEGKASADAARELVKIGTPIVKPVAQVLTDPRPSARRAAANVLNQLGMAASPATPSLIDALDDKDPDVRHEASEALAKIGTPEAKKALRFFPIKDKFRRWLSVFIH